MSRLKPRPTKAIYEKASSQIWDLKFVKTGTFVEPVKSTEDSFSPVTSHQSPVTSHQSPVTSHQSPAGSVALVNFHGLIDAECREMRRRDVRWIFHGRRGVGGGNCKGIAGRHSRVCVAVAAGARDVHRAGGSEG